MRVKFILSFSIFFLSGKCLEVLTSVGEDTVLPCSTTHDDVNDADLTVHWTRTDLPPDQYVYYWWDGNMTAENQNRSYEGRTSLFNDEVKKGNVSLKLSRVKSSDDGIYTCTIPEINKQCIVELVVGKSICLLVNGDR